jgi:hypothetical protein
VSAHYDHVGYGSKKTSNGVIGTIHNGADDNASGVAALLEVAEALKNYDSELARSILIVFWDAEEKGLWGAKHWLQQPTVDLRNVRLMINVDMVGRLRKKLSLFGTRSMPGMRLAWSSANAAPHINLEFPWQVYNNSDHYPFLRRRIPVAMVHTGLHKDYHLPSDDVQKLNYGGIYQATDLIFNFVVATANRDVIPPFRDESLSEKKSDQRNYERPVLDKPQRLGITISSDSNPALRIEGIRVGSAAEKAGLKPGQFIYALDDISHLGASEFRRRIAGASGTVKLRVGRDGRIRDVIVPLAGKPLRVGISWRTNSAEPNSVTVSDVTTGLPAERGGLQRLDRIHEINGKPIDSSENFRDRMTTLEGNVEVLIERDGNLQVKRLDLPAVRE